MKKFCDIQSRNELADYLGIPRSKLTHILYVKKPDSYYTTFEIPKRNGDTRAICAPSGDLKVLQKKLSNILCLFQRNIWDENGIKPNISHGFEKEKSIITNAKIHRNKRYVLNLDLASFFDSFHFGRIQGYFEKNNHFKLPHDVAVILAQLTCYQGRLPQGAPSSPIITNLICQSLDAHLLKAAKKYKLDYTRYAVCLSVCKQLFQIFTAFGVLRRLTEKVFAAGELSVKLVIQIVTVGNDDDSGAF